MPLPAVVLAVALVARLAWIAILPAPGGDEGVWADHALHLLRHEPFARVPGSEYASDVYPHLLAMAMRAAGPTFVAARLVNVLAGVACVALVFAIARRAWGSAPAAIAGLLLAVHPLHVAWSRTAAVPYVLQATIGLAGAWLLAGTDEKRRGSHAIGVPLLALPVHFGPIHAATVVAVGVFMLGGGRWRRLLRAPALISACATAAVLVPLLRTDASLVHVASGAASGGVASLARNLLFGLGGTWTLVHFSTFRQPGALPLGVAFGAALIAAGVLALRGSERGGFARLCALQLAAVAVVVPALLRLRGFDWTLGIIDDDRYLVQAAPYLALLCGHAASRLRASRAFGVAVAAWLGAGTAGAFFVHNLRAGGADRGAALDGGGGARVWRVASGPEPTVEVLARDVREFAGARGRVNVVAADHAFVGPLEFLLHDAPATVSRLSRAGPPPPGSRACVVAFSAEAFAPGYRPAAHVDENARARDLARDLVGDLWSTHLTSRDGSPLAELTCGTRR